MRVCCREPLNATARGGKLILKRWCYYGELLSDQLG